MVSGFVCDTWRGEINDVWKRGRCFFIPSQSDKSFLFVSTPEKVFCFSNKLLSQVYMFLQTVVLEFQPKSFTWLNELHSSGKILAFSLLL